jgi:transposase
MNDRSGLSRGDRNRNARLARLRQLLPFDHAIVGSTWLMTSRPRW